MSTADVGRRRPRSLAIELVSSFGDRIREGRLAIGAKMPTEAAIMAEFEVSRTVVREALSKLQAAGLVETRHGIGTFVLGPVNDAGFKISQEQLATHQDVIWLLELRIGVETEAAALAAQRRTDTNLAAMSKAIEAMAEAFEHGHEAVSADFNFHLEVARASQNDRYVDLMTTLGCRIIPRSRLDTDAALSEERKVFLRRVNGEHESIFVAIAAQDPDGARAAMRTHLVNSRERRRRAQAAGH